MSLKHAFGAAAVAVGLSLSAAGGATAGAVMQPGEARAVQQQAGAENGTALQQVSRRRRYWGRYRHRHYRRPYFGFYFGYPRYYGYYRPYRYRYAGQCSYWHRRCVNNWGYRNSNYYGCMRYHGCR